MTRAETVQLPFLGTRNYLQGTTLFSALWKHVPGGNAQFSFKASRFIRSDVIKVEICDEPVQPSESWDATLKWKNAGRSGVIAAIALSPTGAPTREEYAEESVIGLAEFSKAGAKLDAPSPFNFVSTIVSLNKAFLLRYEYEDPTAQWIFTRLDMGSIPGSTAGLVIDAFVFGPGRKTCRSSIDYKGEKLGHLYFACVDRH